MTYTQRKRAIRVDGLEIQLFRSKKAAHDAAHLLGIPSKEIKRAYSGYREGWVVGGTTVDEWENV